MSFQNAHMALNPCYHFSASSQRRPPLACQDVSQICNIPHRTPDHPRGHCLSHDTPPAFTFKCVPTPDKSMQAVISRAVPHATVQEVQAVPSLRLQRLYGVKVSDGSNLLLALPPPPMIRLLRSERTSISSEAAVLRWLSGVISDKLCLEQSGQAQHSGSALESRSTAQGGNPTVELVELKRTESQPKQPDESMRIKLSTVVPKLVVHAAASTDLGIEYNVMRPPTGVPISQLDPTLTVAERKITDFETGKLYRQLTELISPNGRFGPAFAVLPTPPASLGVQMPTPRDANARLKEAEGAGYWSTAFQSLLEGALRDGEDMTVMLNYAAVRRQVRRFSHFLDKVKKPRLVAIDIGDDANVLVHRFERTPAVQQLETPQQSRDTTPEPQEVVDDESETQDSGKGTNMAEAAHPRDEYDITVTGLKDWSHFIFGDPLFATIFGQQPSIKFLQGFNGPTGTAESVSAIPMTFSSGQIEDRENAHVRLLLYQCYHTAVLVIREFFRPQRDSSNRELAARKKLNDVLAKLDVLDDTGHQRARRPSGEMSPAKRPKSEGEEN